MGYGPNKIFAMSAKLIILRVLFFPSFILNYLTFKIRDVQYSIFPEINGSVIIRGKGKIIVGEKVKINSSFSVNPVGMSRKCSFFTTSNSTIMIGNNVGISNSLLYSTSKIEIEDNVLIGGGCQLLDNDFHPIDYEKRIIDDNTSVKRKPILLKEGCFIGASTIILKGVTIGTRSIIGAGSIVTRNVPDNEVWAGNPAVFVRKLVD